MVALGPSALRHSGAAGGPWAFSGPRGQSLEKAFAITITITSRQQRKNRLHPKSRGRLLGQMEMQHIRSVVHMTFAASDTTTVLC